MAMQTHPQQQPPSRRPLHSLFPLPYPQTPSRQKRKSSFVKYSPPSRMSAPPSARTRYFDDQRAPAPVPASAAHQITSVYPSSPTPSSRDLNSRASSVIRLTFRTSRRSMPSSKGEPTDPELREKIKEEVKAEEKGGGEGKWSAWKAGEMARRYEAQGGDYEDKGDHKNKSQKGAPEKKEGK